MKTDISDSESEHTVQTLLMLTMIQKLIQDTSMLTSIVLFMKCVLFGHVGGPEYAHGASSFRVFSCSMAKEAEIETYYKNAKMYS